MMDDLRQDDRWMTIAEARAYLNVSRATLYLYMSDGRLPYYHIKGSTHRRIKKSDLDALLVLGTPDDAENAADPMA